MCERHIVFTPFRCAARKEHVSKVINSKSINETDCGVYVSVCVCSRNECYRSRIVFL